MSDMSGLRIADPKHIGLAEMLKGGVVMDVTNAEQARIAEQAGAASVMALERVPSDIRRDGGVARMAAVRSWPRRGSATSWRRRSWKPSRSISSTSPRS